MSDHSHYGEYADVRHDHEPDYAARYHRHYDDERAVGELRSEISGLREELLDALERIRALESRQPGPAGTGADDDRHQAGGCWCGDVHPGSGAAALRDEEEASHAER